MKITWIGTGIMGMSMVKNLSSNYKNIHIYNRTYEKALKLEGYGTIHRELKDAVIDSDIIFLIVGYPKDVSDVINECFKYAKKESIIVDMTTSSPILAKELYNIGLEKEIYLLDAPVTGGDIGAINKTLSIMVGGDLDIFNIVLPLFNSMGETITYMGESGNGQFAKLSNQIAIAGSLVGVCESLTYAIDNKLNLNNQYKIMMAGSAGSTQLKVNGLKIINKDFNPGFFVKHFLKDLKIAVETSNNDLANTKYVIKLLENLVENGFDSLGTQALILNYLDNLIIDSKIL